MKIKICMVVPDSLVKGGIAAVVNGYHGSLLEEKCDIVYVESYCDGTKRKKFMKAISGYLNFVKILLFHKPQIVHIHSSFGPSFFRKIPFILLSVLFKIPVVNHIHGADFESLYDKAGRSKRKLIRKIYNKCDSIIALSDEWKNQLSQIVPVQKISVVENYCVLAKTEPKTLCHNQILFLGEIGERKGCYDIPDVIQRVVSVIPSCLFVLAGEGKEEDIKDIIRKMGLEKNVSFPGWVRGKEKDSILKNSDIFFLPSYNEGMPMSVLDAMGYGLPIVSTNIGGIPKLVSSGKNGYLENPGDIEGFSRDIELLLTNKKLLNEYGNESINIVKNGYTLDAHINKIMNIYEHLINRRRKEQPI